MKRLHPKKLLQSKWTAVTPQHKDKHFMVVKVVMPETPGEAIEWVELEALFSRQVHRIAWRELRDVEKWRQGWV